MLSSGIAWGLHLLQRWWWIVAAVWLAGSAAWFMLTLAGLHRFQLQVESGEWLSPHDQRRVRELALRYGLDSAPPVILVDRQLSPLLFGCGPFVRIVFPRALWEGLTPSARDTLLLHELAHFARCDHWVRVLEYVVTGLFWWHPVVWLSRKEIEHAEEQCCDAWVVSEGTDSPRTYAEALLSVVDFVSERPPLLPPITSGLGDVPFLKLRLTQIMRQSVASRMPLPVRRAWLAYAVLMLVGHPGLEFVPRSEVLAASSVASIGSSGLPTLSRVATEARRIDRGTDSESATSRRANDPAQRSQLGKGDPSRMKSASAPEWWERDSVQTWADVASSDGQFHLTAGPGRMVKLLDQAALLERDLTGEQLVSVMFVPNESRFVAGSEDGRIRVWDAPTGTAVSLLGRHRAAVRALALSPDGRLLATGSDDGSVRLWNLATGGLQGSWESGANGVTALRFSGLADELAVATGDWRTPDGGRLSLLATANLEVRRSISLTAVPAGVDYTSDDGQVLAADWSGRVTYWNPQTGEALKVGQIDKQHLVSASFSSNERLNMHVRDELASTIGSPELPADSADVIPETEFGIQPLPEVELLR